MALGPNEHTGLLWRIARNPLVSPDPCWEELELFLEEKKVDTRVQKPEDWMKSFDEIRRKIESIKNPPAAAAEQPSPIESERQPDNAEVSDSGYQSDTNDQSDTIYALFEGTDDYPEGRAPLNCIYSDKYDESYILETVCDRFALHPGKDGKVNLTYVPRVGGKSAVEKCIIRKYDDGDADVGFKVKKSKEIGKADVEEKDDDHIQGMHYIEHHTDAIHSQSREVSTLQQRSYDREANPHVSLTVVAIGVTFQPLVARGLSHEDCMDLGRMIGTTVTSAETAAKEVQYPSG